MKLILSSLLKKEHQKIQQLINQSIQSTMVISAVNLNPVSQSHKKQTTAQIAVPYPAKIPIKVME